MPKSTTTLSSSQCTQALLVSLLFGVFSPASGINLHRTNVLFLCYSICLKASTLGNCSSTKLSGASSSACTKASASGCIARNDSTTPPFNAFEESKCLATIRSWERIHAVGYDIWVGRLALGQRCGCSKTAWVSNNLGGEGKGRLLRTV